MKTNIISLMLFSIALMMCIPSNTSAQDFQVGGIAYNILSEADHTVEVCQKTYIYQGNISIPPTVNHGGVTYDVVALGSYAFSNASISNITIPTSVTQIKSNCFLQASLPSSINIPASVTEIGILAFAGQGLAIINVNSANPAYCSIDGVLFSKDTTTLVACPTMRRDTIYLPQATTHIAPYAFIYCDNLAHIVLHEGIVSIGNGAFTRVIQLNNITIPSTVSQLGFNIFAGCTSLTNIVIAEGNSHYYIDNKMIYSSGGDTLFSCHQSADSLFLPNTLRVVGGFYINSDIRYVHVPEGVTTIVADAFNSSTLESIDLPDQMDLIDESAFVYCSNLVRVAMPSSLGQLGHDCFVMCSSLPSIVLPNNMRVVPFQAFAGCFELEEVIWGDSIEVIDSLAFTYSSITHLTFPPTLRVIRSEAFTASFDQTEKLKVVFTALVDTLEDKIFTDYRISSFRLMNEVPPVTIGAGCLNLSVVDTIIVPCGTKSVYQNDPYWGQYDCYVEDCDGVATADSDNLVVTVNEGVITVQGISDQPMCVYDLLGRTIANTTSSQQIRVPTKGIYLVRVGDYPIKKIAVF